jgi:hypothetical protein
MSDYPGVLNLCVAISGRGRFAEPHSPTYVTRRES